MCSQNKSGRQHHPIATALLCFVHRGIGSLDQILMIGVQVLQVIHFKLQLDNPVVVHSALRAFRLLQVPQNRMRTHINIGSKNEDDVSVNSFELSPRYTVPLGQGLSIGVGPSLAVYRLSGRGYEETLLAGGVAAGINYRSGALFLGADVRFHDTEKKQGADFDNWTVGVKVGVNF
jgi:hypothetical protein